MNTWGALLVPGAEAGSPCCKIKVWHTLVLAVNINDDLISVSCEIYFNSQSATH